jgi:hypothetical protein
MSLSTPLRTEFFWESSVTVTPEPPPEGCTLPYIYDEASSAHQIGVCYIADGLEALVAAATAHATRCLPPSRPVVFCPFVITFTERAQVRDQDLVNGLALSVEGDMAPSDARTWLEGLLALRSRASVVTGISCLGIGANAKSNARAMMRGRSVPLMHLKTYAPRWQASHASSAARRWCCSTKPDGTSRVRSACQPISCYCRCH